MPGKGLYAITPGWYPDGERLVGAVRAVLAGGAAMVQFRDKSGDDAWRRATAEALLAACEEFHAPLIINDDVGLAAAIGADGVHLGRDDGDPAAARDALGQERVIGVSCYDQYARAVAAAAAGASYLAFGSMSSSPTKPGAVRCDPGVLGQARALGLPLVAIGGITHQNGAPLIRAGADFLAVISAVFDGTDIRAAAQRFASLWGAW
jgi:thiamine-phosphate pyrophosphorylase